MGRLLFIRVSAVTYDEQAMYKAWPNLCALGWGEGSSPLTQYAPTPTVLATVKQRGVVELATVLCDLLQFGDIPDTITSALGDLPHKCKAELGALEEALGNRDVAVAHNVTNALEDTLDNMEKLINLP